ncbi:MAG: ATP-dependent sacrificial sulfur transferase LarE [Candidatus Hodarchaeaceae archaeon]|nr:ATP-dependent sacrificial sulfur transferase LarE [Candidatus Hodarchaeaceae archaeon]
MSIQEKLERLKSIIEGCESAVIAFSGGVDSALVCAVAHEVLGERAVAVTAVSPTYPPGEIEVAREVAERVGIDHVIISTDELNDPNFVANPLERCYFCKGELLRKLDEVREKLGFKKVLDGTNYDDLSDFRPGIRAVEEFKAISPLALAGLTKQEVRALALEYNLPNADKPANPCLASRIPFGCTIVPEKLERIAKGEGLLRSLGFEIVRVRDHGDLASVEVGRDELTRALELRDAIIQGLKRLGYTHVALDLEGYRTGSLVRAKRA